MRRLWVILFFVLYILLLIGVFALPYNECSPEYPYGDPRFCGQAE